MAYINGEQVLSVNFIGGTGITDQEFNPESENAQSGKAVAQAILEVEEKIPEVDSEISDSSTNPVQNKVIYKHINDTLDAQTIHYLLPEMSETQTDSHPTATAVVNYAQQKENWQLLFETELTETVSKFSQPLEALGDTTKGVRVAMYLPPNTTLSSNNHTTFTASFVGSNSLAVNILDWKPNESQTVCVIDIKPNGLIWDIAVSPYTRSIKEVVYDISVEKNSKVRYIRFSNATYPIGTIIKIWGLQ